ncbi:MAG: hypothetical protein P8X55_05410, partial [Desulfosarcinaceae bacterium]
MWTLSWQCKIELKWEGNGPEDPYRFFNARFQKLSEKPSWRYENEPVLEFIEKQARLSFEHLRGHVRLASFKKSSSQVRKGGMILPDPVAALPPVLMGELEDLARRIQKSGR